MRLGRTRLMRAGVAALLLALAATAAAGAQVGSGYDLSWSTLDGGGATFSTGGGYTLGGTIGQPEAGQVSNAPYGMTGGFWAAEAKAALFIPLVMRQDFLQTGG